MTNRHILLNEVKTSCPQYWAQRALAQLMYLDEINKLTGAWEALLNDGAALVYDGYKRQGAVTPDSVNALERLLAPASSAAKAITIDCVAHAHIDMNWQWGFDETVSVTIDTLRTMLRLMDEYPAFTFAQSQASVYRIIEQYAPEMLDEIRRRIAEGRWEVTAATWVETDKNMPNGESLTRHLLYTRRYLKDLLGLRDEDFTLDFEPDTFGHGAHVPEILASGGVKYYYHCRGYDGHNLYRWRSPSGATVTVFREPTWYIDTITGQSFMHAPAFCHANGIDRVPHLYGVGDHGGGPTRRDIERIIDMDAWPCMPRLRFGRLIDFFRHIDGLNLPYKDGELNFVFTGCYTSQSRIKKANRVAEASLFDAEAANAFSALWGGYPYSQNAFFSAWENVMFNLFHDILPGSGVIETREHALGLFQQTMACAGTRTAAALRSLSSMIDTSRLPVIRANHGESTAEGAGAGFGAPQFTYTAYSSEGGSSRLFNVFNMAQRDREGCVTLTVWDWHASPERARVLDENGAELPTQLIDTEPRGYWLHSYFQILVYCDIPAFGYRTLTLDEAPAPAAHTALRDTVNESEYRYVLENDLVRAEFDPSTIALVSFIDKETGVQHIDCQKGGARFRYIEEDGSLRMTSWRTGRYGRVRPLAEGARVSRVTKGSLMSCFTYEYAINASKLTVTVSLCRNSKTLRLDAQCAWREFGEKGGVIPQLGFYAPLAHECREYLYDCAAGTVRRGPLDHDVPAASFAFAPRERGGVQLMTDCKYGYRGDGSALSVTLIRSSYDPDPIPECCDHAFSIGLGIVDDYAPSALIESSRLFCRPAIPVTAAVHPGCLPPSGALMRLAEGNAVISCVKMPEDGRNALIVRLYEVSGRAGQATLALLRAPSDAQYVDAHENALTGVGPAIRGSEVIADLSPYGITAIRLVFGA